MRNKYEERIERLQAKFADAGIEGLYISHVENVSYFTGKKGNDCTLWITPDSATILTDFRYREMAQELTWLRKVLLVCKLSALAEKSFESLT